MSSRQLDKRDGQRKLSSRQAVYERIAALKIEAVARGELSNDQVGKLDKFLSSNPQEQRSPLSAVLRDEANPAQKTMSSII